MMASALGKWADRVVPAFLFLALAFLLSGCPAPASPTPTPDTYTYADLVSALQAQGATVERTGETKEPGFSVAGQILNVDGARVTVYEYASDRWREADSQWITPSGSGIRRPGSSIEPDWACQPNFWARGRIIVLYVGREERQLSLLTHALGGQLNEPGDRWANLPSCRPAIRPTPTATPGPTDVQLTVTFRKDEPEGKVTLLPGQAASVPLPQAKDGRACCYDVQLSLPKGYDSRDLRVVFAPESYRIAVNSWASNNFAWGTAYFFYLQLAGTTRDGPSILGTPVPGVVTIDVQGVKGPDGSTVPLNFTLRCGLEQGSQPGPPVGRAGGDTLTARAAYELALPVARQWQAEARLVSLAVPRGGSVDAQGRSARWDLVFFAPSAPADRAYLDVAIEGNQALPAQGPRAWRWDHTYLNAKKPLTTADWIDGGEALRIADDYLGRTYVSAHPEAVRGLTLQMHKDSLPACLASQLRGQRAARG